MRIVIATVQVPFISGGAEILAEMLLNELQQRGHAVEIVTIPFKWYPKETLLNCMAMGRMIDLSEMAGEKIDLVIAMKFPAYFVKHDNKVLWLLHQYRQAYDLWETQYGDLHLLPEGEFIRNQIIKYDNQYIREAKKVFSISNNITGRLKKYNDIDSLPLYHPPLNYEKMHCDEYGDFVFYPSRIDPIKRQRLLLKAAKYVKTDVKIIISGDGSESEINYLKEQIKEDHLENRVILTGFITEEEKINYYARCLCVYFGAYDEDYGYVTLESFFSRKPVIAHKDAGGPLEFVEDGLSGYVLDNEPQNIASAIDEMYMNKDLAERLGNRGYESMLEKKVSWDHVINQLLRE